MVQQSRRADRNGGDIGHGRQIGGGFERFGLGVGAEQAGRGRHVECLMRTGRVVGVNPFADAAWAVGRSVNGPDASSSSRRSVWCQRSIFPVVVGENGLVRRVVIPFSRHTRSNNTSAGRGRVKRPVNCFPLSVKTSDGTP